MIVACYGKTAGVSAPSVRALQGQQSCRPRSVSAALPKVGRGVQQLNPCCFTLASQPGLADGVAPSPANLGFDGQPKWAGGAT